MMKRVRNGRAEEAVTQNRNPVSQRTILELQTDLKGESERPRSTSWKQKIQACLERIEKHPYAGLANALILERLRQSFVQARQLEILKEQSEAKLVFIKEVDSGMNGPELVMEQIQSRGLKMVTVELPGESYGLTTWIWNRVRIEPADCVILEGVSMPLVLTGLLYKLAWGSRVLVLAKDTAWEALPMPITINEIKTQVGSLPCKSTLRKGYWLRLAVGQVYRFDGVLNRLDVDGCEDALTLQRREIEGAQLNALEALMPDLASQLIASRFWRCNHSRLNWEVQATCNKRNPELVSIIIPVYGDANETDCCLQSIRDAVNTLAWEVVAVMNDDSPQSTAVLSRHGQEDPRIKAIWPGENVQFALGCNLGFSASQGSWIVFLNNDCRVTTGWLDALLTPLGNPAVAATQPRLVKPDRTIQSLGVVFHNNQTLGYPLYAGLSAKKACANTTHRLQALTGACLALRAKDFADIRGFDCQYINSQEDIDLCLRLLQVAGRQYCLSLSTVEVTHGEAKAPGRFSHSTWSRHQFVRRWKGRVVADDVEIYRTDQMFQGHFSADRPHLVRDGIGAGRYCFSKDQWV